MSQAVDSSLLGNTPGHPNLSASGGSRLVSSIVIALALTGAAAAVFFVRDRDMLGYATLAVPIIIGVVCHPRLALYQFIFSLFVGIVVIPESAVSVVLLSALVLIAAAALDLALKPEQAKSFPALSANYIALLAALFLTALFAFEPSQSIRSITRVGVVFVTFLALVRLLRYFRTGEALRVYFLAATAHAVFAAGAFIASGGQLRSFAFAPAILDDLLLLALPVGLALYLGARAGEGRWYALGAVIVFAGLIATQSRAALMFGLLGSSLVMYFMTRRTAQFQNSIQLALARSRVRGIFLVTGACVLLSLVFLSDLFAGIAERFERIITTDPGGTFKLRLILWKGALLAFWDNPLFGIGPGNFTSIHNIYSQMHMDPGWYWVRGLSATSLFMHYLAETGMVGTVIMLSLFVKQLRLARAGLQKLGTGGGLRVALYVISFLVLLTTIFEAGWLWGHASMIAVLFFAIISSQSRTLSTP
ncbi:MAG: O-antigen ligase family protein [candidate division Zixibacteria bacterium]|nr:O-antigen ligase family protein [candidate division Zixibacteria bacterium]